MEIDPKRGARKARAVALIALFPLAGCQAATNAANGADAYLEKVGEKLGQGTEDTAITVAVKGALLKADEILARQVRVGTFKGRVSLSGTVPAAADKARAEQIALGVKGVTGVLNALEVGSIN
jgi:osmotically-inducible protein OsmY